MLILFNKYINTIIYILIYMLLLHGWLSCSHAAGGCVPVAGAGILLAGVVVLPGGWWMCPRGWCRYPSGWCCCPSWWLVDVSPWLVVPPGILARIFTAGHPGGYARHSSARRALAVEIQVSKE